MRPINCPNYAWIYAAELAAKFGVKGGGLWSWPRSERSRVLLASLDAVPGGCATSAEIPLDAFQECWEAAFGAAKEVMEDRRLRKLKNQKERP